MNLYILNTNGVFFSLCQFVDASTEFLIEQGCRTFVSADDLYEVVMKEGGLDLDEIEGCELRIYERDGVVYCYDVNMGIEHVVDGNVETFIVEYEV